MHCLSQQLKWCPPCFSPFFYTTNRGRHEIHTRNVCILEVKCLELPVLINVVYIFENWLYFLLNVHLNAKYVFSGGHRLINATKTESSVAQLWPSDCSLQSKPGLKNQGSPNEIQCTYLAILLSVNKALKIRMWSVRNQIFTEQSKASSWFTHHYGNLSFVLFGLWVA